MLLFHEDKNHIEIIVTYRHNLSCKQMQSRRLLVSMRSDAARRICWIRRRCTYDYHRKRLLQWALRQCTSTGTPAIPVPPRPVNMATAITCLQGSTEHRDTIPSHTEEQSTMGYSVSRFNPVQCSQKHVCKIIFNIITLVKLEWFGLLKNFHEENCAWIGYVYNYCHRNAYYLSRPSHYPSSDHPSGSRRTARWRWPD